MRKLLLLVFASLAIGANAQVAKGKLSVKPEAQQKIQGEATFKSFNVLPAKEVKAVADKSPKAMTDNSLVKSLKPVVREMTAQKRAAAVQEKYEGTGIDRKTNETVTWEMETGSTTEEGTGATIYLIQDVVPNPFGFEHVVVEYTVDGDNIVIKPQLIASSDYSQSPTGKAYIFLEDSKSSDGSITLTMDSKGSISGSYSIIYSMYPNEVYNYNEWMATYYGYENVRYNLPGEVKAPEVSFEPANLILYAGLGLNGYSYTDNYAFTAAYATTNFANRTTDTATEWKWSATYNGESQLTDTKKDFSVDLKGGDMISNVTLVGINKTEASEPFTMGVGKYISEGTARFANNHIFAGGLEGEFILNQETPAIITRQDPDGKLTFYTNFATPDKNENSMTKFFLYHEKPAAPLYIEGITLPMVNFSAENNFNLHVKIVKASYPESATKPTLGEVLAEGDANLNSINANFQAGLTAVEFTELYKESDDGLTEPIDYLFIDSEFVIIIEGWDNGTFKGVLGCQDTYLKSARTSTWFELTGVPDKMYSYTGWQTSMFVGFLGAAYGYLHTTDATTYTLTEGGQIKIHVNPMLSNSEADPETGSKTRLWLDSSSSTPSWIKMGFANEVYTEEESSFDLILDVEAMPSTVTGRAARLVFAQEGALLPIFILQGDADYNGIENVVMDKNTQEGIYNLQGVRIATPQQKGVYISNGKKFIVK